MASTMCFAQTETLNFTGTVIVCSGVVYCSALPDGTAVTGTYTFTISSANAYSGTEPVGSPIVCDPVCAYWELYAEGGQELAQTGSLGGSTPIFSSTVRGPGISYSSSPPSETDYFYQSYLVNQEGQYLAAGEATTTASGVWFYPGGNTCNPNTNGYAPYFKTGLPDPACISISLTSDYSTYTYNTYGYFATPDGRIDYAITSLTPSIVGAWTGTLDDSLPGYHTILNLTLTSLGGTSISGTFQWLASEGDWAGCGVENYPCYSSPKSGVITGDGTGIDLVGIQGYEYKATLSPDGSTLSGTFQGPTGDSGTWTVTRGTTQPLSSSLIDPISAGLVNGSGVTYNGSLSAAISQTVSGVAADGVAQVVLRITGANAGDSVQITLSDGSDILPAGTDAPGEGYLDSFPDQSVGSSSSVATGGTLTVIAQTISGRSAEAFAIYTAPQDFVRPGVAADIGVAARSIDLQIIDTSNGSSATQKILIVRPPVLFVHGIWGDISDFYGADGLTGLYQTVAGSEMYLSNALSFALYDSDVNITSSTPSFCTTAGGCMISGNSLGFKFGATKILPQVQSAIIGYKLANNVAVVQTDVIGHSMGGDVTRTLPLISGYFDQYNYNKGFVHKLITIGTPHQGSPLAAALLQPSNACVSGLLQSKGRYQLLTATVAGTSLYNGGVGDLSPASVALNAIEGGTATIPTAMLGSQLSSSQLAGIGKGSAGVAIKLLCGGSSASSTSAPLALSMASPGAWTALLGPNDGVVPLSSQFDGQGNSYPSVLASLSPPIAIANAVHSVGTESFGFAPPAELDQASGIPADVIQLLNTPVYNSIVFEPLP